MWIHTIVKSTIATIITSTYLIFLKKVPMYLLNRPSENAFAFSTLIPQCNLYWNADEVYWVLKQMLQRIASLLPPNAPFLLFINNNSLPAGNMRNTCNSNWELEAYSVFTLCSYIIELQGGNIVGADALELKLRKFIFFVCLFFLNFDSVFGTKSFQSLTWKFMEVYFSVKCT